MCLLNLLGSLVFTVASACYFVRSRQPAHMGGGRYGWEYLVAEWGVRGTYAAGSALFALAAALSLHEIRAEMGEGPRPMAAALAAVRVADDGGAGSRTIKAPPSPDLSRRDA